MTDSERSGLTVGFYAVTLVVTLVALGGLAYTGATGGGVSAAVVAAVAGGALVALLRLAPSLDRELLSFGSDER